MTWTNLSQNYTNSPAGIIDFANASTSGYFGGTILALVWIIVVMATHERSPKFSFVVAGFFASITAVFLKIMLASFGDIYLLAAFGSFILSLFMIVFLE